MSLPDYFWNLSDDEQKLYAKRAGCSIHHLINNIYRRAGPLKQPRPELLVRLVLASEGNISLNEAIQYFLVEPVKFQATEMGVDIEDSVPSVCFERRSLDGQLEIKSFEPVRESAKVGL